MLFSTPRYVFPAPATCSSLGLSRALGLVLSFFGIPALMRSTSPGWDLSLTLLASFNTILDLPFVADDS